MFETCLEKNPSPESAQRLSVFRAERGDGKTARRLVAEMSAGDARNRARLICATGLMSAGKPKAALASLNGTLPGSPATSQPCAAREPSCCAGGRERDGHTYDAGAVVTCREGQRIIGAYPCGMPGQARATRPA